MTNAERDKPWEKSNNFMFVVSDNCCYDASTFIVFGRWSFVVFRKFVVFDICIF